MSLRGASPPRTVDEYLARVPPRFRASLERLRTSIRDAAPNAEEVISYQMPAFRQNGMLVYFAAFEDHCSLFVASAKVRRRFASELRPFLTGKATIRFKPDRPLSTGLVKRIVRACVAEKADGPGGPAQGVVRADPARREARTRPTSGRRPTARAANRLRPPSCESDPSYQTHEFVEEPLLGDLPVLGHN